MISILEQDMKMITELSLPWSNLQDQTILISGANGFIPSYMVETLLYLNFNRGLNCNIIGLVLNKEKALQRFNHHRDRQDLRLVAQDISKPFTIDEKIDFIVHAASKASPKYYGVDPVGTLSANVMGTHHLLELAVKHRAKNFLYFSSGEVYGEVNAEQIPTSETCYGYVDPTNVRSCYAESKRMGENMVVSYVHQYDLTAKIVRPFHTYGPGLSLDDGRVYADFLSNIIHNKDIMIHGDGSAVRAFCYLSDATAGFFTVFLKGINSQAYNIGNPDCSLSIIDLATQLTRLFSERNLKVACQFRPILGGYLPSNISVNCPDISKVKELGWYPQTDICEGFRRTVESYYECNAGIGTNIKKNN
jgi:UDP-glucuronate decarboxylase